MKNKSNETIRLGKVVNTVGLKGEIRVYPYTDYKEKFEELPHVIIDGKTYAIENVRYVKAMALLKLSGVDSVDLAEKLKDQDVFILREDAPPLPEDTFYVKDLIGLAVKDGAGLELGRIKEVIIGAAQDIYIVEKSHGEKTFPIPAVSEFIKAIKPEEGYIVVELIEGLEEL